EHSQIQQERNRLVADVSRTEAENSALTARHQGLVAELSQIQQERGSLLADVGRLLSENAALKADKQSLDAELQRLNCERRSLTAELHQIDSDRERLNSDLASLRGSTSRSSIVPLHPTRQLLGRLRYSTVGYALMLGCRVMKTRSLMPLHDWQAARVIRRSGLFDRKWYIENNLDVASWGINPIYHYVAHGAAEGRN